MSKDGVIMIWKQSCDYNNLQSYISINTYFYNFFN